MRQFPYSFLALFVLVPSLARTQTIDIEVAAGGHDRMNCPVTLAMPESFHAVRRVALVRKSDGQPIGIQRFGPRQSRKLTWMIHDRLPAGQIRRYQLKAAGAGEVFDDPTQAIAVAVEGLTHVKRRLLHQRMRTGWFSGREGNYQNLVTSGRVATWPTRESSPRGSIEGQR